MSMSKASKTALMIVCDRVTDLEITQAMVAGIIEDYKHPDGVRTDADDVLDEILSIVRKVTD